MLSYGLYIFHFISNDSNYIFICEHQVLRMYKIWCFLWKIIYSWINVRLKDAIRILTSETIVFNGNKIMLTRAYFSTLNMKTHSCILGSTALFIMCTSLSKQYSNYENQTINTFDSFECACKRSQSWVRKNENNGNLA